METSSTMEKSILLKISEKLALAQQELDELAVQLALGKAEAKDKFEEIKKDFRVRLNELRQAVSTAPKGDTLNELVRKIEELEMLLTSGKAETKDLFETQKKKILKAILEIENALKGKFLDNTGMNHFTNEFEKFKLKLEILRLKFVVKKFEVKDEFRTGMKMAKKEITGIMDGTKHQFNKAKEKLNDFSGEISQAYQHLRKGMKHL